MGVMGEHKLVQQSEHIYLQEKECKCGKLVAACGTCGQGWAQVLQKEVYPGVTQLSIPDNHETMICSPAASSQTKTIAEL